MNILILHRSKFNKCLYQELLTEGHNLYLLKKKEALPISDERFKLVQEFVDFDSNLVELAVSDLQNKIKFDRVIALHEYDIIRAGVIRSEFNIIGQKQNSALEFRDKFLMKKKILDNGIKIMPFEKVDTLFDLLRFVEIYNYPIVIKPRLGASGLNVEVIRDGDEFSKWINDSNFVTHGGKAGSNISWMVEKFIDGILYHVDGVIYQNEIKCIYPSQYLTSCLSYKEDKPNGSVQLDESNPLFQKLVQYTSKVLTTLSTPNYMAFHAELFSTSTDDIYLCEIASRVGGGQINKCMEISLNVNLKQLSIKFETSTKHNVIPIIQKINKTVKNKTGFLTIQNKPGVLKQFSDSVPFEWVKEYTIHVTKGTNLKPPNSVSDYIASVVVIGENSNEVSNRLWEFYKWFWTVTEISD